MSAILRRFGSNVRNLRVKAKLSQQDLADAAKLSRVYVSEVESGQRNPSLLTVVDLARALGVKVDALLRVQKRRPAATR